MTALALWQFRNSGLLGRLIRAETWGAVNHDGVEFIAEGLYLDVGRVLRLTAPPAPKLGPDEWAVRYVWQLPGAHVARALREAERLTGADYGIGELLRFPLATRALLRALRVVHVSSRRLVCSAAVESVFRAAGLPLVHEDVPVHRVSPQLHHASTRKYEAIEVRFFRSASAQSAVAA